VFGAVRNAAIVAKVESYSHAKKKLTEGPSCDRIAYDTRVRSLVRTCRNCPLPPRCVLPFLKGTRYADLRLPMGGPSAGMAGKIARNVIFFGCLRAGYEGATLARAAGVDIAKLAHVVENSEEGTGGPMMLMGRPDPSVDPKEAARREYIHNLMNKDLEAALELGKALGVPLPLVELTRASDRAVVGFRKEQGA
jgi:3-hydroxyisobutyrate dehydrogenase